MLLLVPAVLLLAVPGCCGLWTVDRLSARSGGSITVPCHYNYRFRGQVKYWCKGKHWLTCITVRNSVRVNITDSPAELVTTLTLTGLQVKDAGRYWCAVKRGLRMSDIKTSLELQVTDDTPALWVNSSSVSGVEGGNVSVRCYYSDRLKDDEKKWCRSGDLHSCQSEQDTQLSQNSKLQLRDEGQGLFTVSLSALQKDDGGWYWCMAGGTQSPVHLTITAAFTTQNHTDFPERNSSLQHSATTAVLTSTHTPYYTSTHPTHTPYTSTHSTHTQSISTHLTHTSYNFTHAPDSPSSPETAQPPSRTPTTRPTSSPTARTKHPPDSPTATSVTVTSAASRLYVWLLASVGIIVTAAVATALIRRGQKHREVSHMMLEEAEPMEFTVKDDVDLLDHEWTNRTVLKVEEEPNTAAQL
ncbi:polymeric immunoglobulin receptor [Astyanax mexicanus]|uniref:polymeric immunoglobulin receptor n=1 Tax=Astyanax mexicanus TaxID=7994 RepID=UPI0020CAB04A|nr:polymeric immunoglobulin receptor [Astyanax mexicanus]